MAWLKRTRHSACRLMEKGAESEQQLWTMARVMSGEEYEQVRCCCVAAAIPAAQQQPLLPSTCRRH